MPWDISWEWTQCETSLRFSVILITFHHLYIQRTLSKLEAKCIYVVLRPPMADQSNSASGRHWIIHTLEKERLYNGERFPYQPYWQFSILKCGTFLGFKKINYNIGNICIVSVKIFSQSELGMASRDSKYITSHFSNPNCQYFFKIYGVLL